MLIFLLSFWPFPFSELSIKVDLQTPNLIFAIFSNISIFPVAKRTSMSRGRIGQLETNPLAEVKGANLVSLAAALGFSTEKLLSKEELLLVAGVKTKPLTRKIPILLWASLSSINKGEKLMLDSDRWIGCPDDIGENSFALEVENDLMTSNSGRSYPVACEHKFLQDASS